MKLLWIIHGYPPHLNAGAEMYTHNLNKFLVRQGHTITVLVPPEYSGYSYSNSFLEGVHISIADTKEERDALVEWSDVVLTHLDFTLITMEYIRSYRPVVWISHNTFFEAYDYINYNDNSSIIYNSYAMQDIGSKIFKNNSFVLHPPSIVDKPYSILKPNPSKNKYITLINCNKNKGGFILKEIAKKMRNYHFIGVVGAYDAQILDLPPNVKIVPQTNKIQEIYDQTKILIMPSLYESWGMTASEAMENGIPVVANKTFGLAENLGYAGTYCPLDNIDRWVESIRLIYDNPEIYKIKSEQALTRAKEQKESGKKQLRNCESFLKEIINNFNLNKLNNLSL